MIILQCVRTMCVTARDTCFSLKCFSSVWITCASLFLPSGQPCLANFNGVLCSKRQASLMDTLTKQAQELPGAESVTEFLDSAKATMDRYARQASPPHPMHQPMHHTLRVLYHDAVIDPSELLSTAVSRPRCTRSTRSRRDQCRA